MISAEITAVPGRTTAAARELQRLGFRVYATGETISVAADATLWRRLFGVRFEAVTPARADPVAGAEATYRAHPQTLHPTGELQTLIAEVAFVEPPELFT